MLKKCKIVMLPTNEPSKIGNLATYQKRSLSKVIKEGVNPKDSTVQFWNLYIISDDKIKESDYCYSYKTNKIVKSTCDVSREANKNIGFWKKVIATTDKSLSQTNRTEIPQPSQQFIKKFVEEYNRGNIITDVLVEYELISNEEYFGNTVNPDDDVPYFDERLKINHKDNTITIKKVKDSYTKEEVENLIYTAMKDRCYTTIAEWKKWLEENL